MTSLQALAERLTNATGPDREIDAAIWLACFAPECNDLNVSFHTENYDNLISRNGLECALGTLWIDEMEPPLFHYTASLDAAIVLCERALPGYQWGVHCHKGAFRAHATKNSPIRPMPNIADAPRPALALCLAIVRAKLAEEAG